MPQNKKLIVTRCDDNITEMTDLTHPVIIDYANRIGADFYRLTGETPCTEGKYKYHYKIFECKELLESYDRILSLDSDILILPDCPNLFDIVPEDMLGSVFEDVGSRKTHRQNLIKQVQSEWGNLAWLEGYINTGVFVCSKEHKEIFTPEEGKYWTNFGYDDIHIAYKINKLGFKIHELSYKFNNMTLFSEPWNGRVSRFKSHIIHYAGAGIFDEGVTTRLEQLKRDYELVYG